MLVILMDDRIVSPQKVCSSCLMANEHGQPRWRHGQLGCGYPIRKLTEHQADQYECQMGFRIASIDSL
jgi:hypothetical protein